MEKWNAAKPVIVLPGKFCSSKRQKPQKQRRHNRSIPQKKKQKKKNDLVVIDCIFTDIVLLQEAI